jgi:hypothetical protein
MHLCARVNVCVYIYIYIHIYVCVYIYIYIYVYVYIQLHTCVFYDTIKKTGITHWGVHKIQSKTILTIWSH